MTGTFPIGILNFIFGQIKVLRQTKLFTLIHKGGTWQAEHHQRCCTGTTSGERGVNRRIRAVGRHPLLDVCTARQSETRGDTWHIVVAEHPGGGGFGSESIAMRALNRGAVFFAIPGGL